MFDTKMLKHTIVFLFGLLTVLARGQNNGCATIMSEEQMKELHLFQQKLDHLPSLFKKNPIQYIPIKAHIVGNSKGIGYYSVGSLLRAICDINVDYLPTGFRFYLADSIDYINDDALYQGSSDAIWTYAANYKMAGAVNVFFHGAGAQWCGVYFPGVDVVFIKNSCQGSNATTLTHELGHFLSLPHTFSGWENNTTPGTSNIELLNGNNCRSAGDGFCDTKADYVSMRWSCPLPWTLYDPLGTPFKPDSSIYMNYAMDGCQSRFSNEQMAAMQNNLQGRGYAKTSAELNMLPPPKLISPVHSDSNQNAKSVQLKWNAVPGAFCYYLQVARFGDWDYLNIDKLVFDTTALVELYGNWPYAWRIKTITAANPCSSFGIPDTFITYELADGVNEININEEVNIFPNPVNANETIQLHGSFAGDLFVYNSLGQLIFRTKVSSTGQTGFLIAEPGVYTIQLASGEKSWVRKIFIK